MKKNALFVALVLSIFSAQAQQSYEPKEVPGLENPAAEKTEPAPVSATKAQKAKLNEFCLFKDLPPSDIKFEQLGRVKHAKGTYGAAKDIVPALVAKAEAHGANAIAHYNGAQHFGFFPWRLARPIVEGTAIRLLSDKPLNCNEIGGTTVSEVLASGQGPSK